MDKIEKILNELITEKEFDKRLIPYIKEFFRYNAKQFGWNEELISRKINLLKQRLVGIEFIDLKKGLATTDFELKNILIDSSIKGREISQEELIQLFYEIFRELEVLIKEEGSEYYQDRSTYAIEKLKYNRNQTIIQFISNAFNIDRRDVHRIEEIFEQELGDKPHLSEEREVFLLCSTTTFLPNISMAVKRIMSGDNGVDKAHEYITLYATAINAISIRLEDQGEDKGRLKSQYEEIKRMLWEIVDEYCIMADQMQGEHQISSTCAVNISSIQKKIEDCLRGIEPKKIYDGTEVETLEEHLEGENLQEATKISEEEILENTYIQEQTREASLKYEERIRPIIQEYFKRSSQVYGWTKDEFDKKVRNFLKRAKKIEFKKRVDSQDITIDGRCRSFEIELSNNSVGKSKKEEVGIIFHEFEHETDTNIRNIRELEESRIQYNNIMEYATEIGAMYLLGDGVYQDKLCFTHRMNGYGEFKYAGSMMAAALGISEFEFARLRDKGDREFLKWFEERYSYLDIQGTLKEFDEILHDILEAPEIIYMRQLSEAYGRMYNLANRTICARLAHERNTISLENQDEDEFELKSRYEKTKIATNMKLAKRRLLLREKYMRPIIEDDSILIDYSEVTRKEKEQYLALVERLYPDKNVRFDNKNLLRYFGREFRHPIIGKMLRALKRNNVLMLDVAATEEVGVSEPADKCKNFRDIMARNTEKGEHLERKGEPQTTKGLTIDDPNPDEPQC